MAVDESSRTRIPWKTIGRHDVLPTSLVLCTNNIESKRDDGTMSRLWIAILKRKKVGKRYEIQATNYDDYYTPEPIRNINYWAYIPADGYLGALTLKGTKETGYYSFREKN